MNGDSITSMIDIICKIPQGMVGYDMSIWGVTSLGDIIDLDVLSLSVAMALSSS